MLMNTRARRCVRWSRELRPQCSGTLKWCVCVRIECKVIYVRNLSQYHTRARIHERTHARQLVRCEQIGHIHSCHYSAILSSQNVAHCYHRRVCILLRYVYAIMFAAERERARTHLVDVCALMVMMSCLKRDANRGTAAADGRSVGGTELEACAVV